MKCLPRFFVALFVSALLGLGASAAKADTFDFTISGGHSATGTLTTDPVSGGSYLITGISGSQDGSSITGLIPVNGFAANDNLLYPAPPLLDLPGFSFVAGGIDYNVYFNGGDFGGSATSYYETTVSGVLGSEVNFSVVPTPEPSSLLLFAIGLVAFAFFPRRKTQVLNLV